MKRKNVKVLFAERVKELRLEKQMLQRDLAEKLGFKASAVSEWETRGKEPDFSTLIELAILFNVSTDYLLGLEN